MAYYVRAAHRGGPNDSNTATPEMSCQSSSPSLPLCLVMDPHEVRPALPVDTLSNTESFVYDEFVAPYSMRYCVTARSLNGSLALGFVAATEGLASVSELGETTGLFAVALVDLPNLSNRMKEITLYNFLEW